MSFKPVKVVLRSITDGSTYDFVDDGESVKNGTPSVGRQRILGALGKKSPLDGRPAWRIASVEPIEGCPQIDRDRRDWGKDDDARLITHLAHRTAISSTAQAASSAQARLEADRNAQAANVQGQIDVAVKAAVQAALAAVEAKAAPAAKPKATPAKPSAAS